MTTLFKVECEASGCQEPLLVRANSHNEAAEVARDFLAEALDEAVVCQRLTIFPLCEPEDVLGIVYEPAGEGTRFSIEDGKVIPIETNESQELETN